jgi:prepilin peptidase CpaA
MSTITVLAVFLLTSIAVYTDLRWRLIPNRLTLPAVVLGLLVNTLGNGWHGALISVLGLFVGIGLLILPFAVGKMGGGDVKLMGAIGAWLGSYAVVNIALYSAIAGGLIALILAVKDKRLGVTMKKVWILTKCVFLYRAPEAGSVLFEKSIAMPYGVAIGLGVLSYLVFGEAV